MPRNVSLQIECLKPSPEPIDIYIGSWSSSSSSYVARLVKTVAPGGKFTCKLQSVVEGTDFKRGQSLLVRVKTGVGLYFLKNLESHFGYMFTVTPPLFPWWKGTTYIRGGPTHPYLVYSQQTASSFLIPAWQDVFYYFLVA